jgi:predicted DNA-binding WGR domain protein
LQFGKHFFHEPHLLGKTQSVQEPASVLPDARRSWPLGDWSLVREWRRVGSPGTVRKEWFETEEEAVAAGEKLREAKRKKGYQYKLANR